jgi:hypothetical protein
MKVLFLVIAVAAVSYQALAGCPFNRQGGDLHTAVDQRAAQTNYSPLILKQDVHAAPSLKGSTANRGTDGKSQQAKEI